jgi:hypothetical protein
MLAAALIAQKHGKTAANLIGNGREVMGMLQGNPMDETAMDVRSHKLGALVGEQNPQISPQQLEVLIRTLAMKAKPGAPGLLDFSNTPAVLPERDWNR